MSYAKTDREKLLVLQIQHESTKQELMEAKAKIAAMDARRGAPNKAAITHLVDIIKILLTVIVVMAGYKLGIKL